MKLLHPYHQIFGIGVISLGSIFIVYFAQKVKISLNYDKFQRPSLDFIMIAKEKLNRRRKFLILSISLQCICIVLGIHLLIFPQIEFSSYQKGMVGLYYGCMLGLAGFGIGLTLVGYNSYYKPIIK